MVFRKEYKSLEAAVEDFWCHHPDGASNCVSCLFSVWNNGEGTGCRTYMEQHPEKVAHALGLEIVSDPDTGGGA